MINGSKKRSREKKRERETSFLKLNEKEMTVPLRHIENSATGNIYSSKMHQQKTI